MSSKYRHKPPLEISWAALDRATMPALPAPDWEVGLCRQTDPELFFPERFERSTNAKRVCGGCDIAEACLAWALPTRQDSGVWGGKTVSERRRMLRIGVHDNGRPAGAEAAA